MTAGTKGRLCLPGYARLLASLKVPATHRQLVERERIGRGAAFRFLAACHRRNWVHIVDWEMPHRARPLAVYAFGPGGDAPYPSARPNGAPLTGKPQCLYSGPTQPEMLTFLALMDELASPVSALEVVEEIGSCETTVRKTIRILKQLGVVRIAGWTRRSDGSGPPVPLFAIGSARSVSRPTPKVRSKINETYRTSAAQRQAHLRIRMLAANSSEFQRSA